MLVDGIGRLRKERQDADRAEEARIEAYARAKREMEERWYQLLISIWLL